jgi:hypothetical protein
MSRKVIINRGENFGTLDGEIVANQILWRMVWGALKEGKAKLLCDTDTTVMYEIN